LRWTSKSTRKLAAELTERGESKREKDNAKQESLWNTANTRRHVAIGLGAAGIACAGGAVWFYLRNGRAESPSTAAQMSRLILEPVIGRDHAGLVFSGWY
jgi:hypothetical protein